MDTWGADQECCLEEEGAPVHFFARHTEPGDASGLQAEKEAITDGFKELAAGNGRNHFWTFMIFREPLFEKEKDFTWKTPIITRLSTTGRAFLNEIRGSFCRQIKALESFLSL